MADTELITNNNDPEELKADLHPAAIPSSSSSPENNMAEMTTHEAGVLSQQDERMMVKNGGEEEEIGNMEEKERIMMPDTARDEKKSEQEDGQGELSSACASVLAHPLFYNNLHFINEKSSSCTKLLKIQ